MNPEKIFKFALVVLGLCSLITLGVVGYVQYTNNRNFGRAYDIAQQLGYQPEAHIVQYKWCWMPYIDIDCAIYLHFTSDLDLETFGARVNAVPLPPLPSGQVGGGTIFTHINYRTPHQLTVNGRESPTNSSRPSADSWSFDDQGDKRWKIIFYELKDGPRYELDGQPLEGAIVTVMYQLD